METRNNEWVQLTPEEKKTELYHQQILMLKTLFEHHAINQQEYEKSKHDLTEKMGFSQKL